MAKENPVAAMLSKVRGNVKVAAIAAGVLAIVVLVLIANMLVEIPPGKIGVVYKKIGNPLPAGVVIAPDSSFQGTQREVFKPGWHLVNPFWTSVTKSKAVEIPPGRIGIQFYRDGKELPEGAILAPDHSYKGPQRDVLKPGLYMLNPKLVRVSVKPAVEIPQGKKGLVNLKVGDEPKNPDDILVDPKERGYQKNLLDPGTYYINPLEKQIAIVDPVRVPALHMGIVTAQIGRTSSDDIVEKGFKGIQREVLRPGTYWMNPKGFQIEIVPAVEVHRGYVGVVRSRTGTESTDDLVEKGQRGIWRQVLRPGTYYMNPKAFEVSVVEAVKIEAGFVGVVVARTGKEPKNAEAIVVARGERGVQPYTLPAGLHYLNPYQYKVIPVDTRVQKYEMSKSDVSFSHGEVRGDDRLSFPSADGFEVKVDTSIQWKIETDKIPEVVATVGNTEEIVIKIIRPNARAIGRVEGSKLKAEDFIKGEKREQFVRNFSKTLSNRCAQLGIVIQNALVREVTPPPEVSKPLKEREVALLMQKTNEEKQREAQSEASLAEQKALIDQKREVIQAETKKKVAETQAEREKAVATIKAKQLKAVADVEKQQQALILDKQKLEAQGIHELAEAEAYKARALVQADGALDKKLRAWTEVMRMWASNSNLVPRVVVGGGEKGGLTGQELIMQLMAIEKLDQFVKSGVIPGSPIAPPKRTVRPKRTSPRATPRTTPRSRSTAPSGADRLQKADLPGASRTR